MGNLALASAVYLDPRVHYDGSAPELLGDLVTDVEVKLINCHLLETCVTFALIDFRND